VTLIVQKYGGTSVGDIERIKNVARRCIATQQSGNDVVVVVSAMSGETNRLLSLVAQIAGEQTAQAIQLGIEYDPAPPFSCGHPDQAPAGLTESLVASRYGNLNAAFRVDLEQIARQ